MLPSLDDGMDTVFLQRLNVTLKDLLNRPVPIRMKKYFGLRDPVEQGKFWRQSRESSVVNQMIEKLSDEGYPFMSLCLKLAGPCDGVWATNALPGEGQHQWGTAMDCYVLNDDGTADWKDDGAYMEYGRTAELHGLYGGYHFHDMDHVQLSDEEPTQTFGGHAGIERQLVKVWGATTIFYYPNGTFSRLPALFDASWIAKSRELNAGNNKTLA